MANPYYLNPLDEETRYLSVPFSKENILKYTSDLFIGGFDIKFNTWSIPYVMQIIGTRIVNRSNVLQDFRYGRRFSFNQKSRATSFPFGLLMWVFIAWYQVCSCSLHGRDFS